MRVKHGSKIGRVAAGVIVLAGFAGGGGACGSSTAPHDEASSVGGADAGLGLTNATPDRPDQPAPYHLEVSTDSGRGRMTIDVIATRGPMPQMQITQSIRVDGALYDLIEATRDVDGTLRAQVVFGPLVEGMSHVELSVAGGMLTGSYDGRAIAPMATDADPRSLAFQDGGPPPSALVSDDVRAVLSELFAKGAPDANPSLRAGGGARLPRSTPSTSGDGPIEFDKSYPGSSGQYDTPGTSTNCLLCEGSCTAVAAALAYAGNIGCNALAAIPFFGPALVPLCDIVVVAVVALELVSCFNDVCAHSCCPSACGTLCCDQSDTCLNTDVGTCCAAGTVGCNAAACCNTGDHCMSNDQCCPTANTLCTTGEHSPNCCNPDDQCLSTGDCCPGNQVTCRGNSLCCGPGLSCFLPNDGATPECGACDSAHGGELCGSGDAAFCCDEATDVCLPVRTNPNGPPGCCDNETSACVLSDEAGNPDIVCCEPGTTCVRTEPGSFANQSCCPSLQACTNPAICCNDANPCVHPASGPEFCCDGEEGREACANNTECCDPGISCLPTSEAETVCCTSAFVTCEDPLGGNRRECCDPAIGESCVHFPSGHQVCCAPKNICGDACCPLGSYCEAEPTGPQCVPLSGAGGGPPCNPASGNCPPLPNGAGEPGFVGATTNRPLPAEAHP
jgi:hypothetical protein